MKHHVVIIRFHYPENHPKFEWRFAFFQAMVLPRLLSQNVQNFDIAIWCNPIHADRFKALSDRIITFGIKPEVEGKIKEGYERKAKHYFVDFVSWKHVVGLDKYHIQTALDSDDLIVSNDYIGYIQAVFKDMPHTSHISFQPYIFDTSSLQMHDCPKRYSTREGSCFYSIYHPLDGSKYTFLYDDSHLKIGRKFPIQLFQPTGS